MRDTGPESGVEAGGASSAARSSIGTPRDVLLDAVMSGASIAWAIVLIIVIPWLGADVCARLVATNGGSRSLAFVVGGIALLGCSFVGLLVYVQAVRCRMAAVVQERADNFLAGGAIGSGGRQGLVGPLGHAAIDLSRRFGKFWVHALAAAAVLGTAAAFAAVCATIAFGDSYSAAVATTHAATAVLKGAVMLAVPCLVHALAMHKAVEAEQDIGRDR